MGNLPRLGDVTGLADYISRQQVDVVFIALPAGSSQRAMEVAELLGDTTASLYFVPDFCPANQFGARAIEVDSMPLLEVMETPFYGADGLLKLLRGGVRLEAHNQVGARCRRRKSSACSRRSPSWACLTAGPARPTGSRASP